MKTNVGTNKKPFYQRQEKEETDKIDKELRSCMKCRFFWGNDNRCINSNCYKKKKKQQIIVNSKCDGCLYKQMDGYCFPCMKDLLNHKENKECEDNEKKP